MNTRLTRIANLTIDDKVVGDDGIIYSVSQLVRGRNDAKFILTADDCTENNAKPYSVDPMIYRLNNNRQIKVLSHARSIPESIQALPDKAKYVLYIKTARKAFTDGYKTINPTYGVYLSRTEFENGILKALHARINLRVPQTVPSDKWGRAAWRKLDPDYQASLWRDSRAVRAKVTQRRSVYQFETEEATQHYSHLLSDRSDY
jgi:hypothetical protein